VNTVSITLVLSGQRRPPLSERFEGLQAREFEPTPLTLKPVPCN
jgi:hypothetical protein